MLIDVPLVMSQIKLLVMLTIIGGVQAFEGMLILTRGGPGFRSMVPGLWMYFNAFSFQRMGYACAIGVVLFLLIMALTVINLKFFKSAEDLQGRPDQPGNTHSNAAIRSSDPRRALLLTAFTLLPFSFVLNNSLRSNTELYHSFFGVPESIRNTSSASRGTRRHGAHEIQLRMNETAEEGEVTRGKDVPLKTLSYGDAMGELWKHLSPRAFATRGRSFDRTCSIRCLFPSRRRLV